MQKSAHKDSMSKKYIPLYRKYRPKNLQEIVGQEHIKKALTNAIDLNKISHAYLFTGPRGTGKTSIARILAKSLNCQQGPTVTPCEVCPSCVDIKNSTPMDVIEIDAASNRKVEDAQNILEKIQYVPVNGKYKIYIIDEVHMLTNHAFNALLKTLEEPPENVIFILATTEPQKVLETITSRCQRFDFRRITTDDIIKHLKHIAKLENIKIDDDALFTIAKNAAGGMRDSLALLDQVSVLDGAKTICADDVNKLLGRLSFDMLNQLSDFIIQSNPQGAIELLSKIYNSGNEPAQILVNLLGYLKNLLVVKNCVGDELLAELTQLNNTQIKHLKTQSEKIETHQIVFLIEKIIYYIKELKTTTNQHLWLEISIIDLANLAQNSSLLELQERVSRLESGIVTAPMGPTPHVKSIAPVVKPSTPIIQETKTAPTKEAKEEKTQEVAPSDAQTKAQKEEELAPMPVSHHAEPTNNDLSAKWLQLLQNISSTPTVSLLNQHTKPVEISEEKIIIGCKENFLKMLASESKKSAIEEAAKKMFGKHVPVTVRTATAQDFQTAEKKNLIEENKNSVLSTNKNLGKENSTVHQTVQLINSSTKEEVSDEEDYIEHELAKVAPKEEKPQKENFIPSDQVSMVIKLFDGKYID